jgi:hypothetical protein
MLQRMFSHHLYEVFCCVADDQENGQGTWERGTPASDPTSPSLQGGARPETGVNSQTGLMEERDSAGAV